MGDGHLNICKSCKRIESENRLQKKMQDPEFRIKERTRHREKQRKYVERGIIPKRKSSTPVNKEKKQATTTVNNAIRDGKIKKEKCIVCGSMNTEAHHEDYSKPLDVVWLCSRHHADRHIYLRDCEDLGIEPTKPLEWSTLPIEQLEY